ncbi:uncharacterized protein [Rutidosis leptorrhynchoides]|uniref:uncharacterized protein n=1 Tax=Rutidosis leptorrhynchoides TaxID=125765 RepID=UPI003A996181
MSNHISYKALLPSYALLPLIFEEFIIDNALVAWKGTEQSFGSNLKLLKSIDLSNNNFSGKLPCNITRLIELVSLNFSHNNMHGELPKDIGRLGSLDYLDLSFNNLSRKIPLGTQLKSFNSSSYEGITLLYGPPLTHAPVSNVVENEEDEKHGDDDFWKSYYMGMGSGFAVGFWGICGLIFLNRRCRHLLFALLSLAKDWIYVTVVVCLQKFKRHAYNHKLAIIVVRESYAYCIGSL